MELRAKAAKGSSRSIQRASAARGSLGDAGVSRSLPPPSDTDSEPERIKHLTYRERQLLPLVCSGLRNKEIAQRLGISESTVWHHLTAIFTKLKVEDRLALVAFVYRHHLIQHDGLATDPIRLIHAAPRRPDDVATAAPGPGSPDGALSFHGRCVECDGARLNKIYVGSTSYVYSRATWPM